MKNIFKNILKILKLRKKYVLFVCTGNTCRSPMAESLFNAMNINHWYARSAGTSATNGQNMSLEARMAATNHGGSMNNIYNHKSRHVSRHMIENADKIVCLARSHYNILTSQFPEFTNKIQQLTEESISDPIGRGVEVYDKCCVEIKTALQNLKL